MTIIAEVYMWDRVHVEEWRSIPGLPHYEASSFGRIRSLARFIKFRRGRWCAQKGRRVQTRILRLNEVPNGTGGVYLGFNAPRKRVSVSRSICAAFHGRPPTPRHEAAHLDGNTRNNWASNLAWATPLQNAAHKQGHGTVASGERNGAAKLTLDEVLAIRASAAHGESEASLAKRFETSSSNINLIVARKTWRSAS